MFPCKEFRIGMSKRIDQWHIASNQHNERFYKPFNGGIYEGNHIELVDTSTSGDEVEWTLERNEDTESGKVLLKASLKINTKHVGEPLILDGADEWHPFLSANSLVASLEVRTHGLENFHLETTG